MTIALVMIVKDESARIEACLASARQYIDTWTIVDTGSSDNTRHLVRKMLAGIPGQLKRRPWVNFGHNRSQAFDLAYRTADWLLCLDADMTVGIDPGWEPDPAVDAYMVEMGDHDFSWHLPLFLRGNLPWQSVGAAHAYSALKNRRYQGVPTDAIKIRRQDSWSRQKAEWQAEQLEAAYEANPDDSRTVFYLAQTYRELEHPGALALYQKRVLMGGYPEEVFYSAYRGALLLPEWGQRCQALVAAWEMRPTRLEPLHAIIQGFNQLGMHYIAYALGNLNVEPTKDVLFVHRNVWDWGMAFERSIAAYWVGRKDECLALSDELLANPRLPDNVRAQVVINRGYCTEAPVPGLSTPDLEPVAVP